ncbi:hypothetical protein ZOSMA_122G00240 [Zostera marina]|uniref:ABC transporter domain-containing protein n=1 Tax=Zostera marina TaxID=29655 RepID=A0A0K9Q0S0_ZOSMR|nr:hypothetical protein ZOSMA_122G00240 [Zostera marina]
MGSAEPIASSPISRSPELQWVPRSDGKFADGAGKSTLLRILSGRLPNVNLDPKTICLNQQSLMSTTQLRKLCGFVTQNDNLLPLLTVRETLLFSS